MTPGRKKLSEKAVYPLHALRASRALVRSLKGSKPSLLYANAPRTFLPAVFAARSMGVPVFCGLHLIFPGGLERRLIRWCFNEPLVRGILFCSEAVAAPFREFSGGKAFVAPYWVSPRFLQSPRGDRPFRSRWGIGDGDILVGVVGRISPTKGQRFFLDALSPMLAANPGLHLAVAGSSDFESESEEDALQRARAATPAPERVHLHLEMTDTLAFMDSLDVLVVPSLWEEPFGLVAVEGMARSLPVVVTRSGGLAETVQDGETGYIVEKDPAALRRALEALVTDGGMRRRMGQAGRARAEERHHPKTCMSALRNRALATC
jgi:glycosyltransferase involved in cell wall biosynthesis